MKAISGHFFKCVLHLAIFFCVLYRTDLLLHHTPDYFNGTNFLTISSKKKYLIVVGGATASGKTALSIDLARHFDAPILSADSRQFYKEMRIGNARPSEKELSLAKHYFVADRELEETLSAGAFAREASRFLKHHYQKHDYAIVVGGSGLFIKALTEGLSVFPAVSTESRRRVDQLFEAHGLKGLQTALEQADPAYFATVDQHNHARLRRALEVCYAAHHPFSYYRNQSGISAAFTPIYLQTLWPRALLYERIEQRVEHMLTNGLEKEVRNLLKFRHLAILKTLGYQEWFAHFDGEYDRERTIELIKQNSRRYAKRQLTWFRRDAYWKRIFKGDLQSALAYIQLVQTDNLHLLADDKEQTVEAAPSRYKVIQTRLGNEHNEPIAHTILLSYKKDAWLKEWHLSGLSHPAKAILINESLYRSECEKIYAFAIDNCLQAFGFQEIAGDELPAWLKAESKDKLSFCYTT